MRPLLAVLALLLAGCVAPPGTGPGLLDGALIAAEAPSALAVNPWRDREADVALDPLDPRHVAVFYNERPNPYLTGSVITDPITPGLLRQALATSRDGGQTWDVHRLPHAGAAEPGSAWGAFCAMGDPNVLFDNDGVIHVVTLFIQCGGPLLGTANGILHATTADDGATWSDPHVAWLSAGGLGVSFHDRQWTAYDPASGTLGIAWTFFAAAGSRAGLNAIFSTDGGATWSVPQELHSVTTGQSSTLNYMVHATWADDGRFHVTTNGCPLGDGVTSGSTGSCLWHFAGAPGEAFERSDLPLERCGAVPEGAAFDYATSAADLERGTLFAGTPVLVEGATAGVCIFASDDDGRTWPVARFLPEADHPWLAVAPSGRAALAYLALNGTQATPMMAVLDAGTLATAGAEALGPSYEADTDGDGLLEYGDYDAMAARGGRFAWALTQPNQEGRKAGDTFNDLDVWAYGGALRGS